MLHYRTVDLVIHPSRPCRCRCRIRSLPSATVELVPASCLSGAVAHATNRLYIISHGRWLCCPADRSNGGVTVATIRKCSRCPCEERGCRATQPICCDTPAIVRMLTSPSSSRRQSAECVVIISSGLCSNESSVQQF